MELLAIIQLTLVIDLSFFLLLSGALTVKDALDYELFRQYLITVRATDAGSPPHQTDVAVNVTVTDDNDNAPVFVQRQYNALIAEDADVGERLIQVSVSSKEH